MKKNYLLIFLLLLFKQVVGQNTRELENFDKIPMSIQQFEAEGYMANLTEYASPKKNGYSYGGYTYLQFNNISSNSAILLCFYKGVLYTKKYGLKYPMNNMQICKIEFGNLKKHIVSSNTILSKGESEITNKAYGGVIGNSITYYLTKSTKQYRTKSADYKAILDFKYGGEKLEAKIKGYSVLYEVTDLSGTVLDAKTGYSNFEIEY